MKKALEMIITAAKVKSYPEESTLKNLWRVISQIFFFNLFFSGKLSRGYDWKEVKISDKLVVEKVKSKDAIFIELPTHTVVDGATGDILSQDIITDTQPAGWKNIGFIAWKNIAIVEPKDPKIEWHLCFKAIDDFTRTSITTKRCSLAMRGSVAAMVGDGHVVFFGTDKDGNFVPVKLTGESKRSSFSISRIPLL
jgi:hypothetical protein